MLQARTQWHLLLSASSRRQCYAWKHGSGATRVCRHCIKSAAAKTTADRCISKLSSTRLPGCPLRRCRIHPSKSQLAVAFEYKCMAIKRRSFGCSGALRKGITPVSSSCMQVYVASYMQVYIASSKICALLTKNKTPSGHWTGDGSTISEVLIVCTAEGKLGGRTLQDECAACEKNMFKVELLV